MARDRLADALLSAPLVATILLPKIAVAPLSPLISIAVPLLMLTPLIGLLSGRMRFDYGRMTLYLLIVPLLWLVQILRGDAFSVPSMVLMSVLFFTMTVWVPGDSARAARAMRFFLNLAALVAIGGFIQFFLQFAVGARYAFPVEHFLPKSLLIKGFHYLNPLAYGAERYKSNGIFLLEPSQLSQLLAVAIVAELCTYNRARRLIVYALGLIVSYSGTGLMILAICLPGLLLARRRWDLLLLGVCGLALLIMFSGALNLDIFLNRSSEFTSSTSSGFARFVGGFYAFNDWLWPDVERALFGYGAGSFADASLHFVLPAAEMPLNKIVFEFGLVGAAALFGFLFFCMWRGHGPGLFRLAVGLSFFMNGLYVPTAQGIALSVIIWNGVVAAAPSVRAALPSGRPRTTKVTASA